jgi:hypothetical protein
LLLIRYKPHKTFFHSALKHGFSENHFDAIRKLSKDMVFKMTIIQNLEDACLLGCCAV